MRRRLLLLALCAAGAACGSEVSPTPVCTYTVSATQMSMQAAGGSNSVTVTTQSECSWTARSDASWVTIASGASGTGSGSVGVNVSPNTTPSTRTGALTVAGFAVTVNQAAANVTCDYTVTPDRTSFSKDGGTGAATVDTAGPCAWTAASDAPWLTIASGGQGTGGGVVSDSVARNLDIADRRAGLVIAGHTFDILQAGDTGGCQYLVAPVELNVCMSVPNELTTTITMQAACPWTAAAGVPWLTAGAWLERYGLRLRALPCVGQLGRPEGCANSSAVADANGRTERARLPGRVSLRGHAVRDRDAGVGRIVHLRRAAAERADPRPESNAERVCLDRPGRRALDHHRHVHAAGRRQPCVVHHCGQHHWRCAHRKHSASATRPSS